MKVGIDTNVLFYSLNKDNPFHREARENLATLVENCSAVITQQNLVELAAALTKRGTTPKEAEKHIRNFAEAIPVLKPIAETLDLLLDRMKDSTLTGARLFDLYLAVTLMSNGVDHLYTYNERDFRNIEGLSLWKPL